MTFSQSLQRPVMAFHVGVSGQADLRGHDVDALRLRAADLLRRVRAEVLALHAATQAETVPIYAPDPPRLRCLCGLAGDADRVLAEAARDAGWRLVAVLPCAPDRFAEDLDGVARERFRRLLDSAEAVCALDGEATADHASADVGDLIVEQADLLIAIWDGQRAPRHGGTGDVVRHALRGGLPVAALDPSGVPALGWHGAAGDGDVAALLRGALLPPASHDGFPQACFGDRPQGDGWAAAVLRAYDRVVTLGFTPPEVETCASPAPACGDLTPLDAAFAAADRLATAYAARYRAAGLLRYGLILPATLASLVGWYGAAWLQPIGNLVDFVVLLFVVLFSSRGGWEPAHRRFLMYRALAEYFRNTRLLAGLRAVALMPGAAAHEARTADWTSWYGRALVRQEGVRSVAFEPGLVGEAVAFVRGEAAGQVGFLLGRAARFDVIARRLRQVGVALSIAGVAFAGGRAALLMAGAGPSVLRAFNELALVLPAMAPVFLGLLSFNEYGKLATRYRAVAAALELQIAALDRVAHDRAAVLPVARRIVEVMLAERDDWRRLMQARTISAY